MNFKILLLIIFLITGIYILPSVLAKFAGSHTWELNKTGSASALDCVKCHQYIVDELNATEYSRAVFKAHRDAAGNSTYTSTLLNPKVHNSTESGLCLMCHLAKIDIPTSHTQVVVRACTDVNCHGNNETTNNTIYYTAGRAGPILGGVNVHKFWFDWFSNFPSQYMNETLVNYSKGYWTCLGCHTNVGVQINRTGSEYFAHNNSDAVARRYL